MVSKGRIPGYNRDQRLCPVVCSVSIFQCRHPGIAGNFGTTKTHSSSKKSVAQSRIFSLAPPDYYRETLIGS
jgi:hypothetical protein